MKFLALLLPAAVVTVTFSEPYFAAAGTLHLICVALQETYFVPDLLPNCTEPVPRVAAKPVPLMVTSAPRFAAAGASLVMRGAAGAGGMPPLVVARTVPCQPTTQP